MFKATNWLLKIVIVYINIYYIKYSASPLNFENLFDTENVHAYGNPVMEVGGSDPGRDTIVQGVFHPTRQLERFSPPNMPYIVNSKFMQN